MANDKVASQYAKAFLEFLKDAEKARSAARELLSFSETVQSHPELKLALTTSLFSEKERRDVLGDVVKRLGLSQTALQLLCVLSDAKRLKWTEGVAKRLNILLLNSLNVVPLDVISSAELGEDEKKKVETKFHQVLGKKVEASYSVDPHLMGGLKVTASGRTFDGSLSGWLNNIEESLMGGTV